MKQCLGCSGLIPDPIEACPNCAVNTRRSGAKGLAVAAGVVVLVGSSCTFTAIYGEPCTAKQVDGGTSGCWDCASTLSDGGDPKQDPSSICFENPDGG